MNKLGKKYFEEVNLANSRQLMRLGSVIAIVATGILGCGGMGTDDASDGPASLALGASRDGTSDSSVSKVDDSANLGVSNSGSGEVGTAVQALSCGGYTIGCEAWQTEGNKRYRTCRALASDCTVYRYLEKQCWNKSTGAYRSC